MLYLVFYLLDNQMQCYLGYQHILYQLSQISIIVNLRLLYGDLQIASNFYLIYVIQLSHSQHLAPYNFYLYNFYNVLNIIQLLFHNIIQRKQLIYYKENAHSFKQKHNKFIQQSLYVLQSLCILKLLYLQILLTNDIPANLYYFHFLYFKIQQAKF